jgi:hypothetical protein
MLRAAWFVVCLLSIGTLASNAQVFKDQPLPLGTSDPVEFLSPSQVTVTAHHTAEVDLHFRIADGLHINSHNPTDKTLIPTRLAVVEVSGLNVTAVDFPQGSDFNPPFAPKDKLSVYTGEFVLHAHLTAQPGEHALVGALHYQACDRNACLPPRTLPVSVTVEGQ